MEVVVDAWRDDEAKRTKVTKRLLDLVGSLAIRHRLDVSRLLGITVTDRYDDALGEFALGTIKNGRKLTRTKGTTIGVASNATCERSGRAHCQVFLQHQDVDALLDNNDVLVRYLLTHELSHAHDLALKARTIEDVVLEHPADLLNPPAIWTLADVVWNEYAACRKSASEHPHMLPVMYEMWADAIAAIPNAVRSIAAAHQSGAGVEQKMNLATDQVGGVLKFSSYVLGHRTALGLSSLPLPDELTGLLDEMHLLPGYFEQESILAEMWDTHGAWSDASAYDQLLSFARRSYAPFGLYIYHKDQQAKLSIIPTVLERFGRYQ